MFTLFIAALVAHILLILNKLLDPKGSSKMMPPPGLQI